MIASMGGYSGFWPLVASQSVSALYYQFTSTLCVDIIGGYFCSIAIDELGESHPPVGDTASAECLCQWLTAATTAASYTEKSAETQLAKQLCFSFL